MSSLEDPQGDVSIHAPAWGATSGNRTGSGALRVSIHAPAWGATSGSGYGYGSGEVSIHAPAWGATAISMPIEHRNASFDPRPRVGGDG